MKTKLFLAFILTTFLASCASFKQKPLMVLTENLASEVSQANFGKALNLAAVSRGWVITKKNGTSYEAALTVRTHMMKVKIDLEKDKYTVTYLDSVNMDYNPQKRLIHRKYYGWLQNLTQAVALELAKQLNA